MIRQIFLRSLFFTLTFVVTAFGQVDDFIHLPVNYPSSQIVESYPIVINESKFLIAYVNDSYDTIFATISEDKGTSWSEPNIVAITSLVSNIQNSIYLTGLKTATGRIIIAWSILEEAMYITYSDNDGLSFSEPIRILGGGPSPSYKNNSDFLNLTQLADGRIILSFNAKLRSYQPYYKISTDDGATWSEEAIEFPKVQANTPMQNLKIVSTGGNNLLATAQLYQFGTIKRYHIVTKKSTDNGLTWSDTSLVLTTYDAGMPLPETVVQSDGTIILFYQKADDYFPDYSMQNTNIYYVTSTNDGNSWSEENQFTRYVGDDKNIKVNSLSGITLYSFSTQRFTNTYQVGYGIWGENAELSTPPFLLRAGIPYGGVDMENRHFIIQARVIDDGQVQSVQVDFPDVSISGELFDDGQHNDEAANDSIYGNTFPLTSDVLTKTSEVAVNNVKISFDYRGRIGLFSVFDTLNTNYTASDVEGYRIDYTTSTAIGVRGAGGSFDNITFLFSAGFMLSGYNGQQLWANGVAPSTLTEDYLPGRWGDSPYSPSNRIYTVYSSDPPFGSSWLNWKDAVENGADFYDGDNDGIYNPVDKNRNGTWDPNEDMPALIGDVTSWFVYNDALPDSLRRWNIEPQGIEVQQMFFASSNPELQNIVFIKYSIKNTGAVADVLDSVYFSFWADPDIGDYTDDIAASDTLLNSCFTYNDSTDFYYGDTPPAVFRTLLQGPVVSTSNQQDTAFIKYGELLGEQVITSAKNLPLTTYVYHVGGDPDLNDPSNAQEERNYQLGLIRTGQIVDPCTFMYGEVRGGVDCSEVNPFIWFSGDPVTQTGWINTTRVDLRDQLTTGAFKLEKDKPVEIIGAFIVGRGNDNINSIIVGRDIVRRAIREYKNNFASMTYTPPPPLPVTDYKLYQNYPNPFNPKTTIRFEIPRDGLVTIKVYDILGQQVAVLLNEFKTEGRYEVEFDTGGNIASGVYIYRMDVNEFSESKKMIVLK